MFLLLLVMVELWKLALPKQEVLFIRGVTLQAIVGL